MKKVKRNVLLKGPILAVQKCLRPECQFLNCNRLYHPSRKLLRRVKAYQTLDFCHRWHGDNAEWYTSKKKPSLGDKRMRNKYGGKMRALNEEKSMANV